MTPLSRKRRDELARLRQLSPLEIDDNPSVHGVLLSDEIIRLSEEHKLICPFKLAHLKPAAYELTIGDEFFQGGEYVTLTDDNNKIVIPPFEVAVIQTAETLCMPRFLIGRWNIRVRHAYRGLLWVGGPQVDAGYVGRLFCPLYNLSDKHVTLIKGDEIAVIDFVKTTPFRWPSTNKERYARYPETSRPILEDFGIDDLRSALFTQAGQKIRELSEGLRAFEVRFSWFTTITFTTLALVVSSMVALLRTNSEIPASIWGSLTLAVAFAGLSFSLLSFVENRLRILLHERLAEYSTQRATSVFRFFRRHWVVSLWLSIFVAVAVGATAYVWTNPILADIRRQQVLLPSDLAPIRDDIAALQREIRSIQDAIKKK